MVERTALHCAIDWLSRREYGVGELGSKLRSKGFPREEIEQCIDRLIDEGLLSDQRYVDMLVRSRVGKGHGPRRIAAELKQKGVPDRLIQPALAVYREDWLTIAFDVHQKKFAGPPGDFNERVRQARFLQYKGFTPDQISVVLDQD